MEIKCVHAKKRSYRAFTKNPFNQTLNTLSFDHTVTWAVYKQFFIKLFHIGVENSVNIRETLTHLYQLAFAAIA